MDTRFPIESDLSGSDFAAAVAFEVFEFVVAIGVGDAAGGATFFGCEEDIDASDGCAVECDFSGDITEFGHVAIAAAREGECDEGEK